METKEDIKKSQIDTSVGMKFDGGKPKFGLIPPKSLTAIARVLTFGAEKYGVGNWIKVSNAKDRYFDAAQRHLWAYKNGELTDPESGESHLSHALCCIMFMDELDKMDK